MHREHTVKRLIINDCTLLHQTKINSTAVQKHEVLQSLVALGLPTVYETYSAVIFQENKYSIKDRFSHKVGDKKLFGKILAIVQAAEFVGVLAQMYTAADPEIDVGETEFYSIVPTDACRLVPIQNLRKEQILHCKDPDLYLVNFYYRYSLSLKLFHKVHILFCY